MSKSKTNTGIGNDRSRHFIGTNDTGISTYSKDFIEKEGKKGRKEIRRQRNSVWRIENEKCGAQFERERQIDFTAEKKELLISPD